MTLPPIDPDEFVAAIQPLLAGCNAQALTSLIESRWTHKQVAELFACTDCDVRKVAALAFGLVGRKCCLPKLAPLLKDPDPMVNQMAEHAMWSVWFRSGSPAANSELCRGSKALNRRDLDHAIEHFSRAIELDPGFAEAYNQRAIVHYLMEHFDRSMADCRAAVDRMPFHFGAWAGLGHCHAHAGNFAEAIRCYRKALEINPHLEGIRQAVTELEPRAQEDEGREV
jgi:tetratricopeptide (TPR) repeat protein